MNWATFFEVGSDVVGLLSGVAFALPTLRTNKLQEGIAKLEQDLQGRQKSDYCKCSRGPHGEERSATKDASPPEAADGADDLLAVLVDVPRKHLEAWSKWASMCIRAGAIFLTIAFAMKLAFYALREDAPAPCAEDQGPVCAKRAAG